MGNQWCPPDEYKKSRKAGNGNMGFTPFLFTLPAAFYCCHFNGGWPCGCLN
ncbi:hypothetical protein [Paenibacillus taichungensis]